MDMDQIEGLGRLVALDRRKITVTASNSALISIPGAQETPITNDPNSDDGLTAAVSVHDTGEEIVVQARIRKPPDD
ncbi:hypothetical protein SAMN04488691_1011124 [Haloferax larsenii]|uniref:Uncharacterized protein n=2 Tax=Haloferax larsenii TaxID=302484 RepID=A0A1H7J7B0_HALLR|nr:hypothetical protein SAMN04488691_1011124 [Haloferax larsenii]